MGRLEAVHRYAHGALGYRDQEDAGLGALSVHAEGSGMHECCLQEYALYRALRVCKSSAVVWHWRFLRLWNR
jgi:hypothetical protein